MLYVEGNSIKLTRGDTAYLTVGINRGDEEYVVQPSDTLTLTVKKYTSDQSPAFQKVLSGETTFHIEPQDTASLAFGLYYYDIQLDTADGDTFTVVDVSVFEIMPEVTY
jgi:hypothetical protein